jgi:diadenosine tetraphosphate (Ap4A) HIT family hydrolase
VFVCESINSKFSTEGTASRNPHVVLINVSPIEYGHVLLVPRILDSLPQQISPDLLQLALEMTAESDNPYFRCGYNSLGAYATINHLHFQVRVLSFHTPPRLRPRELPKREPGASQTDVAIFSVPKSHHASPSAASSSTLSLDQLSSRGSRHRSVQPGERHF